ncbi:protein AMBP-like [Thunnus thynnus]|uniref:protein AMBP-like n=1 Tax=Thunnus thynnus TaxID=8237 RepID=UPI003529391F
MQRVVVSLLVLRWAWILQGVPVLPETRVPIQENFDLGQFMGKWYELAVVSTCPHYMQRKRGNPVIRALELKHLASQANFTMTATNFRTGSCTQTSTDYSLTNTTGQFYHYIARFEADVDTYVVHTNYNEFAMMVLLSVERPSGIKTTTVKLYSRTMDVRAAVMDDFKTLVRQRGLSDDTIINNQNRGECTPGEQVTEPTPRSEV